MLRNARENSLRNHYFFRFGSQNVLFKTAYEYKEIGGEVFVVGKNKDFKDIELAIYYSQQLKIEKIDEETHITELELSNSKSAILNFFESKKGDIFWIFDDEKISAFELIDDEIFYSKNPLLKAHAKDGYIDPKAKRFKSIKVVNRYDVPELFATLDTSGYRGTTLKLNGLKDKEKNLEIARSIISGEKISLDLPSDALKYLSPIQLETLVFKLFNDNGYIVTSYRGGAKKIIDLHIIDDGDVSNKIKYFNQSEILIQVKRTKSISESKIIKDYLDKGFYFLTTDDWRGDIPVSRKYFVGAKELNEILSENKTLSVNKWLKSVLGSKYFEFNF